MRVRSWTACIAVVAAATGAGAATASAATITFDVPFTATIMSTCTGEPMIIEGTTHTKQTDNASLSTPIKSQIEINSTGVKGTTLSGVRYVMNSQYSDMQHADLDDAQLTIQQTLNLTRQGESFLLPDDQRVHVLTHLTVVNGVAKADKFDIRDDCN
jgi:hypothetical protein